MILMLCAHKPILLYKVAGIRTHHSGIKTTNISSKHDIREVDPSFHNSATTMQTQTLLLLLSACCFVSAASKKNKGTKKGGQLRHNATSSHNANLTSNLTTTATTSAAKTTTQAGDAVRGMNIAGAVGALAVGAALL